MHVLFQAGVLRFEDNYTARYLHCGLGTCHDTKDRGTQCRKCLALSEHAACDLRRFSAGYEPGISFATSPQILRSEEPKGAKGN